MKSGENGLIGPGSNDYGRKNTDSNGELLSSQDGKLKVPSLGKIVIYTSVSNLPDIYPTKKWPAIVHDDYDTYPTLTVFTDINSEPVRVVKTVPHKSVAATGQSYWEWPQDK